MDFHPTASRDRFATGEIHVHACLSHAIQYYLVDA
jgi:hypothetical protein